MLVKEKVVLALVFAVLFFFSPSLFADISEKENEMEIFFEAVSVCSKENPAKCASFIKKHLNKIKSPKLSNRLSFLYAEALFKMGNTLQLRETIEKISTEDLSPLERKKLSLIKNFFLLQEDPEIAFNEFIKNWNSYILVTPIEKIPTYIEKATKIGNCEVGLKFTSYLLLAYPDFPLTPKSAFQAAMCFYRKEKYDKAFGLLYRIYLLYPTFKSNLVKMYLIHSSLLSGKKLKVVPDPESFLFSLTLAPPSKDIFRIYLDFLTRKFRVLDHRLFTRGIKVILMAKKYRINLSSYATYLFDLYVPYEFEKGKTKRIVYIFYNLKRYFGLNLKKLSKKSRSYLFASLIDFLAFEEAKKVENSGKIDYSLVPNRTIVYYSFFNLPDIPKEVINSPMLSNRLKLIYLLKVKKDLIGAKKIFLKALKNKEELNFVPSYVAVFKEKEIAEFYKGIEKFEPTKDNYLNFVLYGLILYRMGEYDKIQKLSNLFYSLRTVSE